MTVANSTSRVQYNCSGGTTYPFTFGVQETSEIQVLLNDNPTPLIETTHYLISAMNSDYSSGGTVTTVAAYAAGNKITIIRNVPITQDSDFTEGMPTLYETFEDGLDKLTRIAQQNQEIISRSLTLPASSNVSAVLPNPQAAAYLAWNSLATALESRALINQGSISNAAYDEATWLGVEDVAPSKNAIRDELENRMSKSAKRMKGVTYTYNLATASGTQTLAGAGFTPGLAKVGWSVNGITAGIGTFDGVISQMIAFFNYSGTFAYQDNVNFIYPGITTGNYQMASLSFNSDGGVLTWVKTGSPTGTLNFTIFWLQ